MRNLQKTACCTPLNLRFSLDFWCFLSERDFAALTLRFFNCALKYCQFAKHCHRSLIHRFLLCYLCLSCKQHFGVLTVKCFLNQITTHKMASLENIVTRLRIIVLCYSFSACHQNYTLELLPWNCHLTLLWRKRWPICKILSHASKSPFSFSSLVLIVWATLWSC